MSLVRFFEDNTSFEAFSADHLMALLSFSLVFLVILWLSKKFLNTKGQRYFLFAFCLVVMLVQLAKIFIRMHLGVFDVSEDLPLQLCNMMPFFLAWVILAKNRTAWAVLFFLIMGGTFQALLTPTLVNNFPHYEYWRYWIVHIGLVVAVIYPAVAWGWRLIPKDIFHTWCTINILGILMFFVNMHFKANYLYLMDKPDGDTIYNLLGPWPIYIFVIQFVMLLIFVLIYFIFNGFVKKTTYE